MKAKLFAILIIFIVTACNNDYINPPSPGRVIKEFKVEGQVGKEIISISNNKNQVVISVDKDANLAALVPNIVISDGATISPSADQKIDITTNKIFTYTITSASGKSSVWEIEFRIFDLLKEDYGTYVISNLIGGNYLEVGGDFTFNEKFNDNQKMLLRYVNSPASTELWQKWHLIYNKTIDNVKYYTIRNLHSGKYLSLPIGSVSTGMDVQQSSLRTDLDSQLWEVSETSTAGVCTIVNRKTGYVIANKNGALTNGSGVVLEQRTDADNQKWTINPIEATSYRDDAVVQFFARNNPSQGSVAFDQGTSIPISDGRVLWITQDAWDGTSLRDGKFPCNFFFSYNNSVMIQPNKTDWNPLNTPNMTSPNSHPGRARQVFKNQPGTDWSWPGVGVQIGSDVYIQCGEGVGLSITNQSLYKLTETTTLNSWTATRSTPAGLSGQTAIGYSTGMVKANDGFVYSFGTQGINFGYAANVYVARFPQSNPQQWTFWNGTSWSSTPTTDQAAKIGDALGSSSISYVNGKYVLMTMSQGYNCEVTREIYTSVSDKPTGPFTTRKKVYSIKEYLKGSYVRYYTPAIHPQFDNGKNELLMTYSVNFSGCGVDACEGGFMDPYFYRVKGIRVPYAMIGL